VSTVIDVSGLSKTFRGGRRALDEVFLMVERGEMVALIGPSGSGKSTLLRHLSGLVAGDREAGAGGIRVLGAEVQAAGRISRDVRRLRARVGFVFQQFNLVGRMSVLTNVMVGALARTPGWRSLLGLFAASDRALALAALQRVGIGEQAHQRAATLSGGQQQRAAIARALVQRAEVILADEPIASLDPSSARRVMEILSDVNRRDGITVVVSLHQIDYAVRYCRRTVAMRDGRVVFDGPSAELTHARLADIYGAEAMQAIAGEAEEDTGAWTPEAAAVRA